MSVDDGLVSTARVAANGVMNHGIRLGGVEDALTGNPLDTETIAAATTQATAGIDESQMIDDSQASATFRMQLLEVYTQQALERTAERTGLTIPA